MKKKDQLIEEEQETEVSENENDRDEEDDDLFEEDEEEVRRQARRSRRVRNQAISYTVIGLLLIAVGVGLFIGIRAIVSAISSRQAVRQAQIQAEQEEEAAEAEVTVEAPDSVEEADESQEEEEEPVEDIDYLGEAVEAALADMTTEDKVAQLFITTPESLTGVAAATQAGEGTQSALDTYAVGGLIYSSKNIESGDQLTELLANTDSMSKYELFMLTSEPGGDADNVGNSAITDIPAVDSPSVVGESGDSSNAYNAGSTIAGYLSQYGFNVDLAPDGSILSDDASVAAATSYGSDETTVYDMAAKMVEGLTSGGLEACMTGFPGLGNITQSTADGAVESDISADELNAGLSPYISGIASGAQLIQINNVTYTTADSDPVPASLSRYIISDVLRNSMGYEGVIVTGDLSEAAITGTYSPAEAAVLAVAAGADMICCSDGFQDAYNGLLEAVNDGTITEDRLNESLERIYRVKLADDVE